MKLQVLVIIFATISIFFYSCENSTSNENKKDSTSTKTETKNNPMEQKVMQFASFKLTSDISHLSGNQKKMLPLLFEAANICDDIYWEQAYGDKQVLLSKAKDEFTKKFIMINYGPWERLDANKPFVKGFKDKPLTANFYPQDITKEEFEKFDDKNKNSQYTLIRRDKDGKLKSVWYHEAYKKQINKLAELLKKAAVLADDKGFKEYLNLRAEAVLTDNYFDSDMAWMDMKNNDIDFVVGPIENYEDKMFEIKAAHEAFILIKDKKWSKKLEKYAKMLPEMQKGLPCPDKYKKEKPGSNSDLGAYDVVYYAGDCNAGSKTIAINLPNDEKVQLKKGSRRLQLKNAMQAKFDKILVPISKILIDKDQRKYIKFKAFFENTMFHETAHGLGIKNTINGKGTCRDALGDAFSTIEEGKADILGLYLITKLHEKGELADEDLKSNYVTFMASIFRSIRFGLSSSHGKANMLRFYYFKEKGAFVKDIKSGTYKINMDKMKKAMESLSEKILVMQGDGDYKGAAKWIKDKAVISNDLQADLDRVNLAGIPVDIIFEQGFDVLTSK